MNGLSSVVGVDADAGPRMSALVAEGTNGPAGRVDVGRQGERDMQGIAQGTALRNISAEDDQDLMFMAGERVVLLERLNEGGLCMGYCEGVIGRFNEADVNFAATPAPPDSLSIAPPLPLKSRSRASSAASATQSDKMLKEGDAIPRLRKKSSALEEVAPAISALTRHTLVAAIAMDPSATERQGPRKLMSEENLKVVSSLTGVVGRRQILSSPPAPHPEQSPAPVIPPRSSSRQSKGVGSQKHSLATKSSVSSISSLADPNCSSATITATSLEVKSNELSIPIPRQQRSRPSSRKNSMSSRASSPVPFLNSSDADVGPMQPPSKSKARHSRRQSFEDTQLQQQQELEREQRHQEHDHYLSSVLEDIRSRTNHVLQKMSPTAGLYADRGSKEVDLTVVQMSSSSSTSPPNISVTTASTLNHPPSSAPGITFATASSEPGTGKKNIDGAGELGRTSGRTRSRSVKEDTRSPQSSSMSDTSVADSSESGGSRSMFEKLRPWARSEQRQRSNSGPARHSDSSIQQKMDELREVKVRTPQQEARRVLRQRRPSEATAITSHSGSTIQSHPSQHAVSADQGAAANASKHRSRNWFGIRRGSANSVEDTRKPHPLGHGIQGGIVGRHMSALVDEDEEDDEDTDGLDEDEDAEQYGQKLSENSRLYINDYGFVYDLDDEMNQGQDLTGTGSSVGETGPLGSNVSTMSETERKKASRKQKYNRENELKWIHAATRLQSDSVRKSNKYKKLVRRGVPASVRGRVWLFLAKADLYRQPGLFEELCKRGPLPIHEVIERDIHRCYPDHIHFRDGMGGTGQQDLHSILKAYAHYKPSVGYCQGMGRLVGMMLMQMPVEDAFWLLVATIEGYMQDYYTPSLRQLRIDAQVFERLLKDQDPTLAEHLEKNDVIPLMYMTQWFMTLYTMSLPWASVLRVWDVFYFDGVKALFRVGLAILQLCREHLLGKCPTSSELLAYVLHIPLDHLAPKPLLDAALQIKLRRQSVQKLIAVTAESMDAAAAGDASKNGRKSTHITATRMSISTKSKSDTHDAQKVTESSSRLNSQLSSSTNQPTPKSSAASASGGTSFSPLGVFKARKRAGTIHK